MSFIDFEQSAELDKFAQALCKVQSEITDPEHNQVVDFTYGGKRTNYTYADLKQLLKVARPVLSKHGLCVVQSPVMRNGKIFLWTMLIHSSGQWVRGLFGLDHASGKPQEQGGIITYDRRYALAPMIGVSSETDTDGASLSGKEESKTKNSSERPTGKDTKNSSNTSKKTSPDAGINANTIYDKENSEHEKQAAALLLKHGIEQEVWPAIPDAMHGKKFSELGSVSKKLVEDFRNGIPF